MIETKIIIKNYLRQAEMVKDGLENSLPQEFRKTGTNLLNQEISWFPILSGLESFIENLEEDLKEYEAVE